MSEQSTPILPTPNALADPSALTSEQLEGQDKIIDAVANHPAKLITLVAMGLEPQHEFARKDLGKTINAYQGPQPAWKVEAGPFSYCQDSLEPLGLVVKGDIPSLRGKDKYVTAYSISDLGVELGLPVAGAFLRWELDHPDSSLQRLLGSTNSPKEVEQRAPTMRLAVLRELVASGANGLGQAELQQRLDLSSARSQGVLHWLENEGVVVVDAKYDPQNRTFQLTEPDFSKLQRHAGHIRPETTAAYETAAHLVRLGRTNLTGKEFVDEAMQLFPDLNQNTLWKRLAISIAAGRAHFIQADKFDDDPRMLKRLHIADNQLQAVKDLLETVEKLSTDEAFRMAAREEAYRIVDSPWLVNKLLHKARNNSPAANALPPEEWTSIITPLITAEEDGLNIDALYERIKDSGYKISRRGFGTLVGEIGNSETAPFSVVRERGTSKIRTGLGRVVLRQKD